VQMIDWRETLSVLSIPFVPNLIPVFSQVAA
jgi:hypothetical protein